MSKAGGCQFAVLLADGYSLLPGKVQGQTWKREAMTAEVTGLGDCWAEHLPTGLQKVTLTQSGAFFDDTASGVHALLSGSQTTSRVFNFAIAGNTLGKAMFGHTGTYQSSYAVMGEQGGLTKANTDYTVTGQGDVGVILSTHAAHTVTYTETSVDNAASSANGGVGYLQVSAYATLTNAIWKIQSSANNSTWADLITFATVTSGPTAERKTCAGTVDRYLRVVGTLSGSGSVTAFVGFARG